MFSLLFSALSITAHSVQSSTPEAPTFTAQIPASGKYTDVETHWSIDGSKIYVKVVNTKHPSQDGEKEQFIVKGVDYSPSPLGSQIAASLKTSPAGSPGEGSNPMGDFFYMTYAESGGTVSMHNIYGAMWARDVAGKHTLNPQTGQPYADDHGILRQLGVNNIRVYQTWCIVPNYIDSDGVTQPSPKGILTESPAMPVSYWKPLGPVSYQNGEPSAMPAGTESLNGNLCHNGHDVFLDMCWNNGDDPIYVMLGISVDQSYPWVANNYSTSDTGTGYSFPEQQEFYLRTAKWLAAQYGHHPAVMGFVLSNECDAANTVPTKSFWDFNNKLHDAVKALAPDKLTMMAMHNSTYGSNFTTDVPLGEYSSAVTPGMSMLPSVNMLYVTPDGKLVTTPTGNRPLTPKDIYKPDIYGWNVYNPAGSSQNLIASMTTIANAPKTNSTPYSAVSKPVIFSEIGVSNSLRYMDQTYSLAPNGYSPFADVTVSNLMGQVAPVDSQAAVGAILTVTTKAARHALVSGTTGIGTGQIVYDSTSGDYHLLQDYTSDSAQTWSTLDSSYDTDLAALNTAGAGAAGSGFILGTFLDSFEPYVISTGSGGDDSDASVTPFLSGFQVFEYTDEWNKGIASYANDPHYPNTHNFRNAPTQWGVGKVLSFQSNWDEQWFGLFSIARNSAATPGSGNAPGDQPDAYPEISTSGWLNGGPDALTPRAGYYYVQNFYANLDNSTSVPFTVTPPTTTDEASMGTVNRVLSNANGFITQGGGWDNHSQYGDVFDLYYPWAYFASSFGWAYIYSVDGEPGFLPYIPANGLGWTFLTEFPWVYSYEQGSWYYYFGGYIYNVSTGEWAEISA